MRVFVLPIIIGLLAIGSFNVWIDPGNRWHRGEIKIQSNWGEDQCFLSPAQLNERKFRVEHIPTIAEPNLVLFGSSRGFLIDSKFFSPNVRFYNATVSGASIWDYVWVWQTLKENRKVPQNAIIFLDTWVFNKNTWEKYRWIDNFGVFRRFMGSAADGGEPTMKPWLRSLLDFGAGTFAAALEPFNLTVTKLSLTELPRVLNGEMRPAEIVPIAKRPKDYAAWRQDGSRIYPEADLEPPTLAHIRDVARNIGLGGMYVYMANWETELAAVQLFDLLMRDMTRAGVKVMIVQPPFHQETLSILRRRPDYNFIPDVYERLVSKVAAQNQATYCNALDASTMQCEETEFMDSAHVLRTCAEKIVRTCLSREARWSVLLSGERVTTANVEAIERR